MKKRDCGDVGSGFELAYALVSNCTIGSLRKWAHPILKGWLTLQVSGQDCIQSDGLRCQVVTLRCASSGTGSVNSMAAVL